MTSLNLLPAFIDAGDQSQHYFRLLLKAMSEPGTIIDTDLDEYKSHYNIKSEATVDNTSPKHVFTTTWAIIQTMLDSDCSIYLSPSLANPILIQSIQFYTDATVTDHSIDADFAFLTLEEFNSIDEFNLGYLEAPHRSCTIVIQVNNITHKPQLVLSGPGIKTSKSIEIEGLSATQQSLLKQNHQNYPCGADVIFTTQKQIMALPRSTLISAQTKEQ